MQARDQAYYEGEFNRVTHGLEGEARTKAIKKYYRKTSLATHPDKNPLYRDQATVNFKALAAAYNLFRNPDSSDNQIADLFFTVL